MSAENYFQFCESLEKACSLAGRKIADIKVLPVSKSHSEEKIAEHLALKNFPHELGENYFDELVRKSQSVILKNVSWHYLGALQSRKIPQLLNVASVLHAVSREKELSLIAKEKSSQTKFFIQVNISNEEQKQGVDPSELPLLLEGVAKHSLEKRFLGFMGMASDLDKVGAAIVQQQFSALRSLRDKFCPQKLLNMGMSGDYSLAIQEGSDLIRVGTLIFGERRYT